MKCRRGVLAPRGRSSLRDKVLAVDVVTDGEPGSGRQDNTGSLVVCRPDTMHLAYNKGICSVLVAICRSKLSERVRLSAGRLWVVPREKEMLVMKCPWSLQCDQAQRRNVFENGVPLDGALCSSRDRAFDLLMLLLLMMVVAVMAVVL